MAIVAGQTYARAPAGVIAPGGVVPVGSASGPPTAAIAPPPPVTAGGATYSGVATPGGAPPVAGSIVGNYGGGLMTPQQVQAYGVSQPAMNYSMQTAVPGQLPQVNAGAAYSGVATPGGMPVPGAAATGVGVMGVMPGQGQVATPGPVPATPPAQQGPTRGLMRPNLYPQQGPLGNVAAAFMPGMGNGQWRGWGANGGMQNLMNFYRQLRGNLPNRGVRV